MGKMQAQHTHGFNLLRETRTRFVKVDESPLFEEKHECAKA